MELDELTVAIEGRQGEERRRLAEAHLSCCAHCQTELALFREFETPRSRPDERAHVEAIARRLRESEPATTLPWWKRLWTPRIMAPVALGFATLLVVIAVGIQPRSSTTRPFVPGSNEVVRSQSIEVTGPVGDVAQRPSEIRWQAFTGAARYRIRLMEVDRTELWTATLTGNRATLPAGVRDRIVPLKTLLWEVAALDESGAVVASSGLERFRLQR